MTAETQNLQWIVFTLVVMLIEQLSAESFRSAHLKIFEHCSLTEAANHTSFDADECKYACLAKHSAGKCEAYQWETETEICRLQETLNITTSSSGDSVGVLADTSLECSDDSDCPLVHVCRVINSTCGVVRSFCQPATDCAVILAAHPARQSGVYNITTLNDTQHVHAVWCDMDTDGGGWTVFLKRFDGSVDFYQDFATYKQGFGDVSGEYWLGLDVLHAITSSKTYQLRADISDWENASVYSLHQSVLVGSESGYFKLTIGTFIEGEAGDWSVKHDQMRFSAKDLDNDASGHLHCARRHHGGFWFGSCFIVHPTGKYYNGGAYSNTQFDGMQWRSWSAHNDRWYSMKTVQLKLRPPL